MLEFFIAGFDPFYFITLATLLFLLGLVGFGSVNLTRFESKAEWLTITVRKILIPTFIIVGVLWPLFFYLYLNKISASGFDAQAHLAALFSARWPALLSAYVAGISIKLLFARYINPYLSHYLRKLRVEQQAETPSDVRDSVSKFQKIEFDPLSYIDIDRGLFIGLSEGSPIHVPWDEVYETNKQIIGPTRTGKGVSATCMAYQYILKGDTVIFIDPKPDKFIPHLLYQACGLREHETGVRGRYRHIDLVTGRGGYNPFTGGTLRDRRQRIVDSLDIGATGRESDFYKLQERADLDAIMTKEPSSGHLYNLLLNTTINRMKDEEQTGREIRTTTEETLKEWFSVPGLSTMKHYAKGKKLIVEPDMKRGINIENELLKDQSVIYLRSSLSDDTIKRATRCFITEVSREAMRLANERKTHVHLIVDEGKMLITKAVVDAAATCLGANMSLTTMYQGIEDPKGLDDPRVLDKNAAFQSLNINSQFKIIHGGKDVETPEYAAALSGVIQKEVFDREQTSIDPLGGETWGNSRQLMRKEENLITQNDFSSMPPMTFALYRQAEVARVVQSHWIKVTDKYEDYLKPVKDDDRSGDLKHLVNLARHKIKDKQESRQKKKSEEKNSDEKNKQDKPKILDL